MAKATTLPKPVYAYVGVTDRAVEVARDLVAETQTRLADVTARVEALTKDPKATRSAIEARVVELQAEAKAYPAKVATLVDDNVAQATDAYGDLVKRGESLVGRIRRQESTQATVASTKTTVSKAKTTTTQAKKAVDAEVSATKKTNGAAKKAAQQAVAKKAPVRKSAAKKTATAQSSAKATVTAAKKTAANAASAVADAAEKVGD